jgi:hypothetical protein
MAKRGAKPIGEHAMTSAERQARFRATHGLPLRSGQLADRRGRPKRWADAVDEFIRLQNEYRDFCDLDPSEIQEIARGNDRPQYGCDDVTC